MMLSSGLTQSPVCLSLSQGYVPEGASEVRIQCHSYASPEVGPEWHPAIVNEIPEYRVKGSADGTVSIFLPYLDVFEFVLEYQYSANRIIPKFRVNKNLPLTGESHRQDGSIPAKACNFFNDYCPNTQGSVQGLRLGTWVNPTTTIQHSGI